MKREIKLRTPWLTRKEVTAYTHLSLSYLRQLRAEGRGPKAVRLGRGLKFHRADVDRWLAQFKEVV